MPQERTAAVESPQFPRVSLPKAAGPKRRPLATVPDIAQHYGVSEKTVRDWHYRQVEVGPLMFRVGKYLRARWDDIDRHDADQVGGAAA